MCFHIPMWPMENRSIHRFGVETSLYVLERDPIFNFSCDCHTKNIVLSNVAIQNICLQKWSTWDELQTWKIGLIHFVYNFHSNSIVPHHCRWKNLNIDFSVRLEKWTFLKQLSHQIHYTRPRVSSTWLTTLPRFQMKLTSQIVPAGSPQIVHYFFSNASWYLVSMIRQRCCQESSCRANDAWFEIIW